MKQCKKAGKKLRKSLQYFKPSIHLLNPILDIALLVWMFYGRQENNRINNLHERALRIVYNDYQSAFENLLELDNSVSIHHRNIRFYQLNYISLSITYQTKLCQNCLIYGISTTAFVHKQMLNLDQYIQLLMVYGL